MLLYAFVNGFVTFLYLFSENCERLDNMPQKTNEEAYRFWERVDNLNSERLNVFCERAGLDYNKVKHNRSDLRLMNCMETLAIAETLGTTMEYLLTGERKEVFYSPRVRAIADALEQDQDRLSAVEILLFGKPAGASAFTKNA